MKLKIIEECWGIDRRSGVRRMKQTDEKVFEPVVGNVMEMPIGSRKFTVDAVNENNVTVTVHYDRNPSANKTWIIAKNDSVFYRPRSMDGGYQYTIAYEEENNCNTEG